MARFDAATGKYVYIKVEGTEYRVYFEETGKGIPLVCQHTAGSDCRQWRHLMNDEEITSRYRVIAPDLPYHGKSLPPESVEWWKEEYKLTKSFLVSFYREFNRSLELRKPVYIGCSIGGQLAPDLALDCPEEFRAVIGIGASLCSPAPVLQWWGHPRISNDFRGMVCYQQTAPTSPEKNRREVAWGIMQSAPAIVVGDLHYNFVDHDLRGKTEQIDTSRVAVYLLAGDYDAAMTVAETKELAEHIKGAKFTQMKGFGHFTMVENFESFKQYLMPILEEIASSKNQDKKG